MVGTIDEVSVRVSADLLPLIREMRKAGKITADQAKNMERDLKKIGTAAQKTSRAAVSMRDALKFGAAVIGIQGLVSQVSRLRDSFIRANRETQNIQARMLAMTGDAKAAGEAFQFLQKMAQQQSTDVLTLTDAYGRLLPAVKNGTISMDEMRNILRLANDNIKAFGLSSEESKLLFLGLSQTLTSGTVTMEDLRQVTDRMPGLFDNLAKNMNLSAGELRKLIGTGTVAAQDILPALTEALRENEGAARKFAQTFDSASTRALNSSRRFFKFIDEQTGTMAALSNAMNDLSNQMDAISGNIDKISDTGFLKDELKETGVALVDAQIHLKELQDSSENFAEDGLNLVTPLIEQQQKEVDKLSKRYDALMKRLQELIGVSGGVKEGVKGQNDAVKDFDPDLQKLSKNVDKFVKKNINLAKTVGKSAEELKLLEVQAIRSSKGFDKLTDEQKKNLDATEASIRKAIELKQALEEQDKAAKDAAKRDRGIRKAIDASVDRLDEQIGDAIFNGINEGFSRGGNPMEAFANTLRTSILRSISSSIAGSLTGSQTGGGFGGFGGLASFGGVNLSNLGGLFGGSLGPGVAGPVQPGILSGFGLSGLLQAGGAGFGLGSLVSGFTGGNQVGGGIGGALGGIAGSFSPLGPGLGTAVGGALGGAIGGLFGGGQGVSAAEFVGTAGAGGLAGTTFGSKNRDVSDAQRAAQQVSAFIASLGSLGIDVANQRVFGAVSTSGSFLRSEQTGQRFDFNPDDAQSFQEAISNMGLELVRAANTTNADLIAALEGVSVEGKSAADVLREISVASGIAAEEFNKNISDEILKLKDPTAFAIVQETERFNAQLKLAQEIGADVNKVQQLHKEILDEIIERNKQSVSIVEERVRLEEQETATLVDSVRRAEQLRSSFQRFAINIRGAITNLQLGGLSALSPEQRLSVSRQEFQQTLARALGGDEQALADLPDIGRAFLEQSREFNASNEAFKRDFASVTDGLNRAATFSERQVSLLDQQIARETKQIEILQEINQGIREQNQQAGRVISGQDFGARPEFNRALSTLTGFTGNFGGGGFQQFLQQNPLSELQRTAANAIARAFGEMPGFANGGLTPAGRPFIVGERGPEIMQMGQRATVTTMQQVAPQDNSDIIGVLMGGFNKLVEQNKRTTAQVASLSSSVNRLSSELSLQSVRA
jgi:tape measure domain-containing protein